MKYWILTALLTAALLTGGCDKILQIPEHPLDEYGLPEYSETGSRTIACLVDGEPWVAKKKGGIWYSPEASINASTGFLQMGGGGDIIRSFGISGRLDPYRPDQLYYVKDTTTSMGMRLNSGPCRDRFDNPLAFESNWINVTHFDVDKGIISGTFEAKLTNRYDSTCVDTFHLTHGRFDMPVEYIE